MKKLNCWEYKKCGRCEGEDKVEELGICPATTEKKLDKVHDGTNAGRSCWVMAGTYCGGKKQGCFATKLVNCQNCDFYQHIMNEEGKEFIFSKELLEKLKG